MASAVAWRSASAIAGMVVGKLGQLALDKATLMWTFKEDLAGLKYTMDDLQAWMHDADRRSGQGEGDNVRPWMNKLKSASSNVEDLLDEFEAIELVRHSQSKIKLFFSSYNPLLVRLTMAHKMKKVKEDLDTIEKWGRNLHLVPYNILAPTDENRDQGTIGEIDIGMVGRDAEKEKIMNMLLEIQVEVDIAIIPIIGLGGLGKTTMAKAVFSDKRAKIFDLHVWIYVSKKIDLSRIGKKIISTMNNNISSGTSEKCTPLQNGDLDSIIQQLEKILPNKRYLIVLDDMWEEGYQNLINLMHMLKYGAKGSKIILTTRSQGVVDKLNVVLQATKTKIYPVRTADQINLKHLSDEESWILMRQTTLGQDDNLGGLEDIGRQIAKRCGGLPLLVRSLGFLLSQHKSIEAWEDIRDRKIILSVREGQKHISETMESLMLSYHYLQFNFKLCFIYCAVLPKGFTIAHDHLIQQWAALGYIIEPNEGHYCINYLLGMYFLSISRPSQNAHEHAARNQLTMHDLMHDLASIILENELVIRDASEALTWSRLEKHYSRHMQLVNYQKQKGLKEFPRKIRSLHFRECSIEQLQQKSFSKSNYLRVLDLSGCSTEVQHAARNISLPSSIDQLMLLRYLDVSGLPITTLPKSLHNLQNMQTLILSNCALETLSDNIGSLLKLRYLDISGNSGLDKLPISFENLSALSFLNLSGCSKLKELPEIIHKLECLRYLDMSGCCALQTLPDQCGILPKLLFLNLSNCSKLVKLPDIVNLKSLEHLNLSSCNVIQNLPEDFGNLEILKFLNLSACYKLRALPESFCKLKHLEYLDLSDCHGLEELPTCFGNLSIKFLNLSDCYTLRALPESFCELKHLKDLDLSDCHGLRELPECFGDLSELHSLKLTSCSKLQFLPLSFGDLSKLKYLDLSYCVSFKVLPSSFCDLKLQTLYMRVLQSLVDLQHGIANMTSLTLFEATTGNPIIDNFVVPSILRGLQLHDRTVHTIGSLGNVACHSLQINDLHNVKHPQDAERVKLRDNPDLRELTLCWNHADNRRDSEVLENLVPPRTLEGFELRGYMSRTFPNWMLDISSYLPHLISIAFRDLACDSLPPIGRLPNLRFLSMEGIPNIRKIGKEFYREEETCKKLRVIKLWSLKNLDEWWTTRSGDRDDEFLIPNLHQLVVGNCPKLKFLPCPPKSMYWELDNSDEVLPLHGFGWLSPSTVPFSAQITSNDFSPDKWGRLKHLATLEELEVTGLSSLPEAAPRFPYLRYLHLSSHNLEILPEWLGQFINLEVLIISCPKVTSLPESIQNLHALKSLHIWECRKLVERCKGKDAHKISHIKDVMFDLEV
ncbi:unnamed protein product [Urochloa decumbens]|uniref:Uncharacterized protein n=1 Tax=Urochloa decumbens TaxID=240449 RepID=A0ABC8WLG1_9POAL